MTPIRFEGAAGNALVGDIHGASGWPVLLLHGGGQTRHAWTRTARAIAAEGLRAYSLDQRGHGDSDWVESLDYAVPHFGDDLAAMAGEVTRRTGRLPVVVGASLGGLAALSVEAMRTAPVFAGLVLVDVTPSLNAEGLVKIQSFMSAKMDEGFATIEEAAEAVGRYLPGREKPRSAEGLMRNLRRRPDGRLRWHWDPALIAGPRNILSAGIEGAARLKTAARALDMPTLLVRGQRSEIVTEAELDEFRTLVPHADYIDIAGAGHMVAGDRNDAFSAAIVDFLLRRGFGPSPATEMQDLP